MNSPTNKTYELLSTLSNVKIGKCSKVLPNKCQCWIAGVYQITAQTITPATKETGEVITESVYQKCRKHAQEERDADALVTNAKAEAPAQKVEKPVPASKPVPAQVPVQIPAPVQKQVGQKEVVVPAMK